MIHARPIILNVLSFISMTKDSVSLNLLGYISGMIPSMISINAITKDNICRLVIF